MGLIQNDIRCFFKCKVSNLNNVIAFVLIFQIAELSRANNLRIFK